MKRLFILPLLVLTACAESRPALLPEFGDAVATNMAAQIINPMPRNQVADPTVSGKRMTDAVERYRTGHVYPPVPPIEAVVKEGSSPDQPAPSGQTGQAGQ